MHLIHQLFGTADSDLREIGLDIFYHESRRIGKRRGVHHHRDLLFLPLYDGDVHLLRVGGDDFHITHFGNPVGKALLALFPDIAQIDLHSQIGGAQIFQLGTAAGHLQCDGQVFKILRHQATVVEQGDIVITEGDFHLVAGLGVRLFHGNNVSPQHERHTQRNEEG